jgi:hypothetical protein
MVLIGAFLFLGLVNVIFGHSNGGEPYSFHYAMNRITPVVLVAAGVDVGVALLASLAVGTARKVTGREPE